MLSPSLHFSRLPPDHKMPREKHRELTLLMGSPDRHSSNASQFSRPGEKYVVYPQRWVILATCCLLALSNSMQWISYTTLTIETNIFYCEDGHSSSTCNAGFYTNQIFQGVAVLTGLGGMYITDHYGIRLSLSCGVMLNVFGSIIRLISSAPIDTSSSTRLVLLHTGSVIVAGAQAFFLVLPSKIAECWFPENQRAISNVLTFIANPVGVALGTLIPTALFSSGSFVRTSWMLFFFNTIMCVLAAFTSILSLTIKRSLPPTPPSPSNALHENQNSSFFYSIRLCLVERQFLIQMETFAIAFAQLWGVMVILPDILTARKYTLSGEPTAVCAIVGVLTSLIAGAVADRTKRFKEIIQVCSVGFFVTAVAMRFFLLRERSGWYDDAVILILTAVLGACSIPQFPIGVEMGVETTFPVYEATSSGLLVISGQLCMFVFAGLFHFAKVSKLFYAPEESQNSEISDAVGNWQLALDIWCALSFVATVICICFLRPFYKRIAFEEQTRHPGQADMEDGTSCANALE